MDSIDSCYYGFCEIIDLGLLLVFFPSNGEQKDLIKVNDSQLKIEKKTTKTKKQLIGWQWTCMRAIAIIRPRGHSSVKCVGNEWKGEKEKREKA